MGGDVSIISSSSPFLTSLTSFNRCSIHSGSGKSETPKKHPKSANTNYLHKSAHLAGLPNIHSIHTEHTNGSGPTLDAIIGSFAFLLTPDTLVASTNE